MVKSKDSIMSKRKQQNDAQQLNLPLQTRAVVLPNSLIQSPDELVSTVSLLIEKGINTLIIPALCDGELVFKTDKGGSLSSKYCPGRQALKLLADFPVSLWISVDILSAGPRYGKRLGGLGRHHRDWLMKNPSGGYEIKLSDPVPGVFCWTSLAYRQFMGNLLVDLVDGYPIEGVLIDLRHLPRTDPKNPSTWSHLGYSCLSSMETKLGISIEDFLTTPSWEDFDRMQQWRCRQLLDFLVNIKCRARKCHPQIPFTLLVDLGNPMDPNMPWSDGFSRGMIDEVALVVSADNARSMAGAVDQVSGSSRPYLLAVDSEVEAGTIAAPLRNLPTNGFILTKPEFHEDIELPTVARVWNQSGALESHPTEAALTLIDHIFHQMEANEDPITIFFQELKEILVSDPEEMTYKGMMRIREEVLSILKIVEEQGQELPNGEGDSKKRRELLQELNLVARLLAITPPPARVSL